MTHQLIPFDAADYLTDEETIKAYISQVLADGDLDELIGALGDVAKARGMSQLAKDTGIARESLYKALKPGSKPRFDTIAKVLHAMGMTLSVA